METKGGENFEDRYTLLKVIGEGGMGMATLVKNNNTGEKCVAKTVNLKNKTDKVVELARQEAEHMKNFKHPNIVSLVESFEDEDQITIVMEYCQHGDLAALKQKKKKKGRKFPENQIMSVLIQACMGLNDVHMKKRLHRDIKCENLFIGDSGIVKIGDFGVAKQLEHTLAVASTQAGTSSYMSPELIEGKPYSYKTDIFGLGCVIHEMCTMNDFAFFAPSVSEIQQKILDGDYDPVPDSYSQDLRDLVVMMLNKKQANRPTAREILTMPFVRKKVEEFIEEGRIPTDGMMSEAADDTTTSTKAEKEMAQAIAKYTVVMEASDYAEMDKATKKFEEDLKVSDTPASSSGKGGNQIVSLLIKDFFHKFYGNMYKSMCSFTILI